MSIKYDRIYPRLEVVPELVSLLTPAQVASRYVQLVEQGVVHPVAALQVVSESAPEGQPNPAPAVMAMINLVRKDIHALRAVNPLAYSTGAEFMAALEAATTVVPASTWVTRLREAHGVQTFDELVALLESSEEL